MFTKITQCMPQKKSSPKLLEKQLLGFWKEENCRVYRKHINANIVWKLLHFILRVQNYSNYTSKTAPPCYFSHSNQNNVTFSKVPLNEFTDTAVNIFSLMLTKSLWAGTKLVYYGQLKSKALLFFLHPTCKDLNLSEVLLLHIYSDVGTLTT